MNRAIRILTLLSMMLLLALAPATVLAADGDDEGDLLLRINGPITVEEGQTYDNVIVVSDNAVINGDITGSLIVVDGDATITGTVADDITVISGKLTLAATAQVDNVTLVRGTLERDPGATVAGEITRTSATFSAWTMGVASALVWLGMGLATLLAGLVFAAVGRRQLTGAADLVVNQAGPSLLAALILWIAMPVAMALAIVTLVGLPIGLGYYVVVLPALWFLGYIVAGAWLGRLVFSRSTTERPYLSVVVGLLILGIIGLVPGIGGLVAFVAGVIGSGALAMFAWRAWRGETVAAMTPATTAAAPATA